MTIDSASPSLGALASAVAALRQSCGNSVVLAPQHVQALLALVALDRSELEILRAKAAAHDRMAAALAEEGVGTLDELLADFDLVCHELCGRTSGAAAIELHPGAHARVE